MNAQQITTIARNSGFCAVTSADNTRVVISLTNQIVNIMDVQMIIGFDHTMTRSGSAVIVTL